MAVLVAEDGVEVPLWPVRKHRGDAGVGVLGAGQPARHEADRTHAPATTGVLRGGEVPRGLHRFVRRDPVHLVEGFVVDVARVDARPESAHEPGPRRLTEDRESDGVDAHEAQVREVGPQHPRDAGRVAAGTHGTDEDVYPAELGDELQRQRLVTGHVVGVLVLVRAVGALVPVQQRGDPPPPRLLPTARRMRLRHHLDARAVRGVQPVHDRFEARVGDQGDRMFVGDAGECEPEPESAAGRLDDHSAGSQVTTLPSALDHVQRGPVFMPPGLWPSSLAQKPRPGGLSGRSIPQHRGVADRGGHSGATGCGRGGQQPGGGQRRRAGVRNLRQQRFHEPCFPGCLRGAAMRSGTSRTSSRGPVGGCRRGGLALRCSHFRATLIRISS